MTIIQKRRSLIIRATALAICLAAFATGCGEGQPVAKAAGRDLTIFVASDIHYLAESLTDHGEAFQKYAATGDGRQLEDIPAIVEAFARDVELARPDVLIISGDLTNNGEKESHLQLADKLRRLEESSGTRIYVIPGNHDIQNPWARRFAADRQLRTDSVSSGDFSKIYQALGYGEAISRDRTTASYLATPSDDLWLLMLDTNVYKHNEERGTPATYGQLGPETLAWIRQCSRLASEKNARIVTVMHHNLLVHTLTMRNGYTLDNNEEAVAVFQESGLSLILSGHIHIQDIETRKGGSVPLHEIVTSALIVNPVQYGIIQYQPPAGFDYRTARVDVEGWARATGSKDENLNNFQAHARNHFASASWQRTYGRLTAAGLYTEPERRLMADTMSLLNLNYFAGTVDAVRADVMQSPGYRLLRDATEMEFTTAYVNGMLYDDQTENNRLRIPNR